MGTLILFVLVILCSPYILIWWNRLTWTAEHEDHFQASVRGDNGMSEQEKAAWFEDVVP